MTAAGIVVVYRAGRCGMCDHRLADGHMQDVQLHVLAPAGTVKVRCSICAECRPTPATLESTTARLLERILRWYRTTPAAWPGQRVLNHA